VHVVLAKQNVRLQGIKENIGLRIPAEQGKINLTKWYYACVASKG
jgi:hypothetical protein